MNKTLNLFQSLFCFADPDLINPVQFIRVLFHMPDFQRLVRTDDKCIPGGFLPVDFKKKDGFLRSLRRAAELGLYRQSYCGCEFSRRQDGGSP